MHFWETKRKKGNTKWNLLLNSDFSLDYIITNGGRMSLSKHRLNSNVLWREKTTTKKSTGKLCFPQKCIFGKGRVEILQLNTTNNTFITPKKSSYWCWKVLLLWTIWTPMWYTSFFFIIKHRFQIPQARTHAHSLVPIRKINSPTLSPKHRKKKKQNY